MNGLDRLMALPRFTEQGGAAYQPGFARMEALLDAMERPHERYRCIHVAGTNGKGSTASMAAAIGTAAGLRVGLHTSPHLFRVTERLRVDGVAAPEAWLDAAALRYAPVFDRVAPSFFEATTALALRYFAEAGVDVAVVEVGLGGRLDATSVVHPVVSVVTSIGLDHTDLLGETLPEIAAEKAAIARPGVPLLAAPADPDVRAVIEAACRAAGAPYHHLPDETVVHAADVRPDGLRLDVSTPRRRYPALAVGLAGAHQQANALLALRVAELAYTALDADAVARGLADVRRLAGLRGRLQRVRREPPVLADVGHNPDGLAVALAYAHSCLGPGGRLHVAFGAMRDKDTHRMTELLAEAGARVFVVTLAGERALPPETLLADLRRHGAEVAGPGLAPDAVGWFEARAGAADVLLVAGSHQVVAQLPESWFDS